MENPRAEARCDGCGGEFDPWEDGPVIFDCFHALHAACASGSDAACPCCRTPRTHPHVAGAATASPPESSVACAIRSNGGDPSAAGVGEEDPPVIWCDDCGGQFSPAEIGVWSDECPHCDLRRMKEGVEDLRCLLGSPTWSGSSFGSLERSPSPSDVVDEFGEQPPAAMAIPTFPSQYSNTAPFVQSPPTPVNTFQPPPAQFAPPPPSVFHQYSHPGPFGQPPYFYRPLPPPYFYQRPLPPAPAPACFAYVPAAAASPYCAACGRAVVRGQTAVTSQCNHTSHFRCFAGSVYACPSCGAQWRDVGHVIPPPPFQKRPNRY